MVYYHIKFVINETLIRMSGYKEDQLWESCKTRKKHRCVKCSKVIAKGNAAFRPITNKDNRMRRICEPCINRAIKFAAFFPLQKDEQEIV